MLDATTSTSPSIPMGPIVLIHAISNGTNELAITLRSGSLTYASARSTASRVPAGFAERYRIKSGKTACYQARAKGRVAKAHSYDKRWQRGTYAGGDPIERVPVLEQCRHGAG